MMTRLPTYFISHGGGPWTHMKAEVGTRYDALEASLKDIPRQLGGIRPRAVLVVSGHWEQGELAVMASPHPPMIYDYGGFPEHTYNIRYDAPGSPAVARQVLELLRGAGMAAHLDAERGYDHGTFVPLYAMYPGADVPVLQLSLRSDYDPGFHLAVGQALAPLREEGVLIVGSGLSWHNLRQMGPAARQASRAFDDWLTRALVRPDSAERHRLLMRWQEAPAARIAHPREDHLIPLMVAVGAAGDEPASRIYHEDTFMGGVAVSSYRFGQVVGKRHSSAGESALATTH